VDRGDTALAYGRIYHNVVSPYFQKWKGSSFIVANRGENSERDFGKAGKPDREKV
jgi:hypothetical protein